MPKLKSKFHPTLSGKRRVASGMSDSTSHSPLAPALIGKRELAALLAVNRWTIDRWRKANPDFPKPVWITSTTPRWYVREIEEWLASKERGGIAPSWTATRELSNGR